MSIEDRIAELRQQECSNYAEKQKRIAELEGSLINRLYQESVAREYGLECPCITYYREAIPCSA